MAKKDGIKIKEIGINILKVLSNVNAKVIQYKFVIKNPSPKNHPYLKYSIFLVENFFWLIIKIKKRLSVKKLIIK